MISEESDPLQGFLTERVEGAKQLFIRAIRKDFRLQLIFLALLLLEGSAIFILLSIDPISWSLAFTGAVFLFTPFFLSFLKSLFYFRKKEAV